MSTEMFDQFVETSIAPDGKPEVKERGEFQRACDQFVAAQRRFAKLDLCVRMDVSADATEWFKALEQTYVTEKRVWALFCAGFATPQIGRLYLEFRDALLRGESPKPNA